jgi:hypothetical protein
MELKMRRRNGILLFTMIAALGACGGSSESTAPAAPVVEHAYNGTASVGDFLSITVNTTADTIAYTNHSNGDSGTVPFTVNADGSYAISDPNGNLIAAYEVPGYALVLQVAKAGSNHATPALVVAVESGPISLATFEGGTYNYMQFRTAAGGLEAGSVSISSSGTGSDSSYWPFGALTAANGGQSPYNSGTIPLASATADASGTFLTLGSGASTATIFGTANGMFAVDTPNGAIFGLKQAASAAFDPTVAGTYHAIYYSKTNATTGAGNVEVGNPALGSATIAVSAQGAVTVTDSTGAVMAQGTLAPVASTSYLYGGSPSLANPCNGMFTFQTTGGSAQQDVFVSFLDKSMMFASFSASTPWSSATSYSYFYGVGLTQP